MDLLHRTAQSYKFSNKNDHFCAWRDFKKKFCGACRYDKWKFKPKISPIFNFDRAHQSWISGILDVKLFLNAKCSLSLWSKWQIGNRKWTLNTICSLSLHMPTALAVNNPKVSKFHERTTLENVFLHYFWAWLAFWVAELLHLISMERQDLIAYSRLLYTFIFWVCLKLAVFTIFTIIILQNEWLWSDSNTVGRRSR